MNVGEPVSVDKIFKGSKFQAPKLQSVTCGMNLNAENAWSKEYFSHKY